MKKKLLLITLTLLLVAVMAVVLSGCTSKEDMAEFGYPKIIGEVMVDTNFCKWWIVKSPLTNRYYEIFKSNSYGWCMSEVTEQDYLKYLEMIEGK